MEHTLSKAKSNKKPEKGCFRRWFQSFLDIHNHRYFRRTLLLTIIIHLLTIMIPQTEIIVIIPQHVKSFFQTSSNLWPFPTFRMSEENNLYLRNLILKGLEISVILLYAVDLLPKIFIWKKNPLWKLINAIVVTLMVIQVPITIQGFLDIGTGIDLLKIRIFSIGLSFLLLCEILSIREQKTIRLKTIQDEIANNQQQNIIQAAKQQIKTNQQSALKEYSWCEIVKHDMPQDCWIVIEGKVYDVSKFIDIHPGGQMILDGAGGETTFMWHSCHPLSVIDQGVPQKYLIGKVRDYEDFYSYSGNFYRDIKKQVEQKIPKDKRTNDYKLFIKAIILLSSFFLSLYYFVTDCTLTSAILLGFCAGQSDVNIMHDGNHVAFSSNKTLTYLAGFVLDLTFSSAIVYRRSHNFGHHGCVNHYELDRAFDTTYPFLRLHKLQEWKPHHRWQHLYVWLIYGLTNFGDVAGTFEELAWMSNYPTRRGYISKFHIYQQVFVKIAQIVITIVLPCMKFGYVTVFPLWMIYMMVHSYTYALFFAVNHWTDQAKFTDNSNISQQNWGILQVINSTNFALDSFLWTNLSGGLNFQIEHHLFPGFAHTRLPEVSQIVQEHCKQNNISYYQYNTFWDALKGHYTLLKQLGIEDNQKPKQQ